MHHSLQAKEHERAGEIDESQCSESQPAAFALLWLLDAAVDTAQDIAQEYLWIKDLPGPLLQALWLQAPERWAAWKKAVWGIQRAQAFCRNSLRSFQLCICLMLHNEDGIYSHSAELLSAAWPAQVYQVFKWFFFFIFKNPSCSTFFSIIELKVC